MSDEDEKPEDALPEDKAPKDDATPEEPAAEEPAAEEPAADDEAEAPAEGEDKVDQSDIDDAFAQMGDDAADGGEEASGQDEAEDLWAAAMEESGDEPDPDALAAAFPKVEEGTEVIPNGRDINTIMDIPVKLSVELGRATVSVKRLLELTPGAVVELDGLAGEPLDIFINGHLLAQGEVVVVDENYGIRVTEIITPAKHLQKTKDD